MRPSLSDAINIQLPYNLERLLFYMTDQNHSLIKQWYQKLESDTIDSDKESGGSFDLTIAAQDDKSDSSSATTWLHKLQTEFRSASAT